MSDDPSPLHWTDQQWASLRAVVQESARKARVASSFLPLTGPLPPDQTTVPAQWLEESVIDDKRRQLGESEERLETVTGQTLHLTTISCNVYLRGSEVADPELGAAKSMLRRAAEVLARLEDAIVFNGQPGPNQAPQIDGKAVEPQVYTVRNGQRHPGLARGKPDKVVKWQGESTGYSEDLVRVIAGAVATLEGSGHYGPFACVLGHRLYRAANTPSPHSLVLPSDRIMPFLDGGPLRRSSAVPKDRGVIVALAGSPIDLVVASDVQARFLQLSVEPRYVLRVSERFVLRMKQPDARFVLRAGPRQ